MEQMTEIQLMAYREALGRQGEAQNLLKEKSVKTTNNQHNGDAGTSRTQLYKTYAERVKKIQQGERTR